jgi:hypothetical protein
MTSEPGTRGRAGAPRETGNPHRGRTPGAGPGQPWPLVVPLALLIILGLAGLRGTVTEPHWNGPLRHDGAVIGLALEVILGVLLLLTTRRRSRAARGALLSEVPVSDVVAKLRGVLILVLGTGMIGVAIAIFFSLHLHLPPPRAPTPGASARPKASLSLKPPPSGSQPSFHVPVLAILYGLLIALLVAAVVLSVWWSQRFRTSFGGSHADYLAEDPEDMREAVESGRSALRAVDDARAAIIACYVAMENSLAERGTARAVADTPDELLARATSSGLVRGTAAARLTALFYEARFSSHPMDRGQRDAAEQALTELAVALAAAEAARAEPDEAGARP